jgi:uncharacterized membrane protein
MAESRNVFVGILAILLGLIIIVFPLISVFTFSAIAGIGMIFLGIWLIFDGIALFFVNPTEMVKTPE